MKNLYHIVGAKKTIWYMFQAGEDAVTQYKRIRRMVGRITERPRRFESHNIEIGTPFDYNKAVATMPRPMSKQFADYIRDLDNIDIARLARTISTLDD